MSKISGKLGFGTAVVLFVLVVAVLDGGLLGWLWYRRADARAAGLSGHSRAGRAGPRQLRAEGVPQHRLTPFARISAETDRRLAFDNPRSIRLLRNDRVLVLDTYNQRVVVLDSSGLYIGQFGRAGKGPGELANPTALDVGPGGMVYVIDPGNRRVCVFRADGSFVRSFPTEGVGESIAVDSRGRVYTNEPGRGKLIAVYDSVGRFLEAFGDLLPYQRPAPPVPGAANVVVFDVDSRDNLWLAFQMHPKPELRKYDARHRLVFSARLDLPEVRRELETYSRRGAGMVYPLFAMDLFVDTQDYVWVLFNFGSAVYRFGPDGTVRMHLLPRDPSERTGWYILGGIAARDGYLWATDQAHEEIVKFRLPRTFGSDPHG